MKTFSTIILVLVYGVLFSQTTFQKIYGELNKNDYGKSIVQYNNGDYLMCGVQVYQDTISGNYNGEGVVRRIDINGNEIWTLNYNDPNSTNQGLEFSDIIHTTNGNLVLTGVSDYGFQNNYYDYFLTKIDIIGNIIWRHNYGGSNRQWAKKVIETSDGGFLMAGYNEFDGSANSLSLYLIKTDSSGILEWDYLHPNTSNDAIRHQAYSVIEDDQDNFLISGSINQILNNGTDFYVVKINSNGNFLWEKIIDHPIGGEGREVFIKNNGNILICGWFAPNLCAKPLIIELYPNGTFLNEYEFNFDSTCEWAYSFCKDENDNVIMLSFDANNKYRITKIDTLYSIEWSHFINYTMASSAEGNKIINTSDNGFLCTGASVINGDVESVAFKVNEDGIISNADILQPSLPIVIFPNPTKEILQIKTNSNISLTRIVLYDLKGSLVQEFNNTERQFDISRIQGGQYLLKLESENGNMIEKIIIE